MKKLKFAIIAIVTILFATSCTENFSNGERVGTITQFSRTGFLFKTYEGHLNVTQTGMNSATGFDFSIDGNNEDPKIVATLDSAVSKGWKVELKYHLVKGYNFFGTRGHTDFFISEVKVLDRNFDNPFNIKNPSNSTGATGKVIDTIYIVITPTDPNYSKFFKEKH